ncbi:hypothetical protein IC582_011586 [Cucumis melo]|uniref:PsbP domain-containing protein 7 n=2 Tax=Cucumis melo TaxID=3656 RepID=A0A5A7TYH2_CUCMM|nr:psbP domain-containing protein 7, chloroplastic isoform X2 [Cucumis melo]KAA0048018.1 psbP domain-containing protein 7 [Cucumis melo var. makuwa]
MAFSRCLSGSQMINFRRSIILAQSSSDDPAGKSAAEEFAPLAATFRRRLIVGIGSASLVAVGANFAGVTSFLLGLSPENSRRLRVDVVYPIGGYNRCFDPNEGFEFIYPSSWVGDQRLLYREAEKSEYERSLDPPPLTNSTMDRRRRNVNEPLVAFGPPGSSGELNVSVIVSSVPPDFSIEAFGGPNEVGEAVIRTITRASKRSDLKGTLIQTTLREDLLTKYYELEFKVESTAFQRHNIAVCCARRGKLYTLNAQAPESEWPGLKSKMKTIASSFCLSA